MNCQEYQQQSVAYLEGLLNKPMRRGVEVHLQACRVCKAYYDTTTQLHNRLTSDSNIWGAKSLVEPIMDRIVRNKTYKPRRITMLTKYLKTGVAAAVIAIGLVGLLTWLSTGNGPSSVAFAEVLETIRVSSYTFDLTVTTKEQASPTAQTMVLEPGRVRFEQSSGPGKVSSIVDVEKGKGLILLHNQNAAMIMPIPGAGKHAEVGGFFTLFLNPVENLWNLQDGTEKELGRKEIDGQAAVGFEVLQEDQHFQYRITIWADPKTRGPMLVKMLQTPLKNSSESLKFTMSNFVLNAELDQDLFSMKIPAGYTQAYTLELGELKLGTETGASDQARKIEELLRLWSQGNKSESVEILLAIDWCKDFTFSEKPYIFTITEKQFISLKPKDQQDVMNELVATVTTVRSIAQETAKAGAAAMSAQDYRESERYFDAVLQFGKLLMRNPDYMVIVRLVGIAVERDALKEMVKLYTVTNDSEKLSAAKKKLQAMQDEQERIMESARSR